MDVLRPDPAVLLDLARARMPFGKYAGWRLMKVPEPYLVWFAREGFPGGKLGEQMALALEIKTNGLEPLVEALDVGE
ncbi:MAG: DUF3820 family protein [Deltaproteobacteria bacterium]|nr:DUF3820 family protein [Deltaproteobacteria bacterium]